MPSWVGWPKPHAWHRGAFSWCFQPRAQRLIRLKCLTWRQYPILKGLQELTLGRRRRRSLGFNTSTGWHSCSSTTDDLPCNISIFRRRAESNLTNPASYSGAATEGDSTHPRHTCHLKISSPLFCASKSFVVCGYIRTSLLVFIHIT